MNTLFENEYVLTKEFLVEIAKYSIKKWYKFLCYIMAIIGVIFGIIAIMLDFNIGCLIISCGLTLFCIIWISNFHKFVGSKAYKEQEVLNNYKPLRKVLKFYCDSFEVVSANGAKTIILYKNIKNICKSDSFLILNSENKIIVAIKKDCFTKGTYEEFKKFIFEKCHG
ncbi:hypothetical protein [Clostridium paraputrificum]|uniref:YcxB-like C-terminal domain-containing protein n=1 Tax=Clostridium paraputrificum TaxID=29363 RepID=A0A6N3FRR7_9CLOT